MIWGTNYYSSMERGYESSPTPVRETSEGGIVGIHELGQSVTEGRGKGTFLDTVKAAIHGGAGTIELSAAPEGGEPGISVEAFGMEAREDLKALAKINNVDLKSVHTPAQVVGNLAGLGEGGYTETNRENQVNEVKKHIDFAADVTEGGAVVVHTGEYPRALAGNFREGGTEFQAHAKEAEQEVIHLINQRTGEVVKTVRKDEKFGIPVYEKDAQGRFVDLQGKPITDPDKLGDRVPTTDKNKEFNIEVKDFSKFRKDIINAGLLKESASDAEFAQLLHKENTNAQVRSELGWSQHYSKGYQGARENYRKLFDFKDRWDHGQVSDSEKETIHKQIIQNKIFSRVNEKAQSDEEFRDLFESNEKRAIAQVRQELEASNELPSYGEFTKERGVFLGSQLTSLRSKMDEASNMAMGHAQNAKSMERNLKDVRPLETFAKQKTNESFVELANHAMEMSKNTDKPIFVAPENIFPTMGYGAHPDELIRIVQDARVAFVKSLTDRGFSDEEADKKAKAHIKATFDTQHLGMWKRHMIKKKGESEEDYDKRFNGWYKDQVKKMHKAGVLGHLHVVDGFGLGHTHVVPGQGVMPVVDSVEYLKAHGYDGSMISEAFGDVTQQLAGTWRAFGTDVYGRGTGMSDNWAGVESGYFSKVGGPQYIVGGYAPSDDFKGAPFYSGVPLELRW